MNRDSYGKITVLKDGNISKYELNISNDLIEEIIEKSEECAVKNIISVEERKLNPKSSIEFNADDVYEKYINNGYIIIREYYPYCLEFGQAQKTNEKKYSIILPYKINKSDFKQAMEIIDSLDNYNMEIFNYIDSEFGKEYDYVNKITAHKSKKRDFADLFLKEKLGILNDEEKELLKNYREFNLNDLINGKNKDKKIHNQDSGVIIIDKDNEYKKTVNNIEHLNAIKIIENYLSKRTYETIEETSRNNGQIIICVSTGMLLGYVPEEINDFQRFQLNEIINGIKKNDNNLLFSINVLNKEKREISSINEFEEIYKGRKR